MGTETITRTSVPEDDAVWRMLSCRQSGNALRAATELSTRLAPRHGESRHQTCLKRRPCPRTLAVVQVRANGSFCLRTLSPAQCWRSRFRAAAIPIATPMTRVRLEVAQVAVPRAWGAVPRAQGAVQRARVAVPREQAAVAVRRGVVPRPAVGRQGREASSTPAQASCTRETPSARHLGNTLAVARAACLAARVPPALRARPAALRRSSNVAQLRRTARYRHPASPSTSP